MLGKVDSSLNVRQQRAAQYLLKDQIESVLFFEKLDQLNDVRMPLAVMKRLNFFKDAVATMTRHFFDYLDILKNRITFTCQWYFKKT